MVELNKKIENVEDSINICGVNNQNIELLKELFNCNITIRGDKIITDLEDEEKLDKLERMFTNLLIISQTRKIVEKNDITYIYDMLNDEKNNDLKEIFAKNEVIFTTPSGKNIYYKSQKQKEYFKSLDDNDIVFSIGCAGTGKTYLGVLYAVKLLKENKVKRIILTRPAVEAGESLGFLPGDLKEKVDPYLRPIYDSLYDFLGFETVNQLIEKNVIEIAPLAYMRGRTLEDSIVILDEAQNTTNKQMMMFLTRLGMKSKMIITGDITQVDLPKGQESGLLKAVNILNDIPGIKIIEFEKTEVFRHLLVRRIIKRYEEN